MSDGSTHFTINPRTRRRFALRSRTPLVAVLFFSLLVATIMGFSGIAFAANPSADLDQCANFDNPGPSASDCNPVNWVNGNLGASKAKYFEGDSIPYRMRFNNLSITTGGNPTPHSVTIKWDTTKSGKHAIDYLTTWNRTVTGSNPCAPVGNNAAQCSWDNNDPTDDAADVNYDTEPIPIDSQNTNATPTVTQVGGVFTLYGGTITSVGPYTYPNGTGFSGDKSASIKINFTTTTANPVLAWGGHIATRADWGAGNSAVSISGSPYHMALVDLDGSGGAQDRSLSADAVIFKASITIVKQTNPASDPKDFTFTTGGGALTPSSFTLDTDPASTPTPASSQAYTGLENFTTYTFTEGAAANWALSFGTPVCTVTSANGGSQSGSTGTRTVTVNLKEGENVTCTFINTHTSNAVTVSTTLTNEDSGLTADGGSTLAAAIGDTVHDSATLDGQTADAGGTISYAFYTDDQCTENAVDATGALDAVIGGLAPLSASIQFNSAGTFYWQATYSGDANNNNSVAVTSPCDEILVVSPNEPTITTQVKKDSDDSNVDNNAHVPTGTVVYDTALLDGATSDVSGDVTYYVEMGDATCSVDGATSLGAKTIDAGLVPDSDNFTLATAGTYYFWADYEGDNNNLGATSACDTEIVIVDASRTGQITPTGTTCKQFDSGLAETLSQLKYGVKNGKVNNVAPGVFFYWIKVTVVAAGPQSFTIQQSITSSDNNFPHFFTTASGSFVYNSSCVKVTTQSVSSTGTVTFTAPTAGTYIIGVKYDAGSVKGFNAPSPNTTVDYRFEIPSVPGSAQDLHLIKG